MNSKRLFACLVIMTALPFFASPTHDKSSNPTPFATVAFAGHVTTGGYACTCGCPDCICDPGESPLECSQSQRMSDETGKDVNQDSSPVGAASASGFDFGSSAMILALAFLVWARFLRT